ncbi:MAG: hypothetical protein R3C05_17290 [Pirellulaceae bacterium]
MVHRRVLLIRDDLNVSGSLFFPAAFGPANWVYNTSDLGWLTGLAKVHQICDLLISRSKNTQLTGSVGLTNF